MYVVGAQIMNIYTGSFQEYVTERIFQQLNMTSTTYSIEAALKSGKVTQTWSPFGRRIPFWFNSTAATLIAGPGGVISNVEDLVCSRYMSSHNVMFLLTAGSVYRKNGCGLY